MELLQLIKIKGIKFPLDRKYYTKNGAHLWLKFEGDIIQIGMDAFAAEMIGKITTIIVDKKIVKCGEELGSFESNKYINKLFSPVSGEIIDVNNKILNSPSIINIDPYNSWIFKIKPDKKKDNYKYIIEDEDQILRWIQKEFKKIEIK